MTDPTSTPQPRPAPRRLTRSAQDSMVGGVCGGLARHLDIDATLVRVLAVLALVLGVFPAALAYVLLWVLMPRE